MRNIMDEASLNILKYRQFLISDSYPLFIYIIQSESEALVSRMINEPDKEKLYVLQKQLQILQQLPNLIKSRTFEQEENHPS